MHQHDDGGAALSLPTILQLAEEALAAYNAADLDRFCACFADDIQVCDAFGNVMLAGMEEFRERYDEMFATFRRVRAVSSCRLHHARHLVQRTIWERTDRITGEVERGEHLARYSERDGRIAMLVNLI